MDMFCHAVALPPDDFPPETFQDAVRCPQAQKWREAMDAEFRSLLENDTWELVDKHPGSKVIPSKWVYNIKLDARNNPIRYKCERVVAEASEGVVAEASEGGVVQASEGGVVHASQGGVVEAIQGGVVEAIEDGVVEASEGGVVEASEGGVVEARSSQTCLY
jgi:hypothetical protein